MRVIGNVIWVMLGGLWLAIEWLIVAAVLALTIIGLPFARQCVKLADFSLFPFGRTVVDSPTAMRGGAIGNVLWFIPGLFIAFTYVVVGIVMCLTVIGIPFGVQAFKFVPLALMPFGKEVVPIYDRRP